MLSRISVVWRLNSARTCCLALTIQFLMELVLGFDFVLVTGPKICAAFDVTPTQHHGYRRRGHKHMRDNVPLSMSNGSNEITNRSKSRSTNLACNTKTVVATSQVLGDLYRIRMEGEEDGFVSAMGVPTFACILEGPPDSSNSESALDADSQLKLEHNNILRQHRHEPAFVLHNLLSSQQCQDIIQACEKVGFADYQAGKNHHGAIQLLVSESTAEYVAERLSKHIDVDQVIERRRETEQTHHPSNSSSSTGNDDDFVRSNAEALYFTGINRRWRVYKYSPDSNQRFSPHIDAGFPPSGLNSDGTVLVWDASISFEVSRLTILIYLNDDFVGGETNFYRPLVTSNSASTLIASVQPQQGACLVFPQAVGHTAVKYARQHWPLHEGAPVVSGENPKYVIRSDVMFRYEPSAQQ